MLSKTLLGKILFVLLFFNFTNAFAKYNEALLVLDARNAFQLPKKFRTSSDPIEKTAVNTQGLADLHIAGGAQFSKLSLQKIVEKIRTSKVIIVDLRQESHGFLNSNAISWYGGANSANAGMSANQIEHQQSILLSQLSRDMTSKVYEIIKKYPNETIAETKQIEFIVHNVVAEEELVAENHLNYKRIYVQDFHAPSTGQVDNFIAFVKTLPKEQWIYFHCRAGVGRTTTFMAMYDMIRNAKQVSLDDILARQAALGGKDLTDLPDPSSPKYKWALERLRFLKNFYQYTHDNQDNFDTTWRAWSRRHA